MRRRTDLVMTVFLVTLLAISGCGSRPTSGGAEEPPAPVETALTPAAAQPAAPTQPAAPPAPTDAAPAPTTPTSEPTADPDDDVLQVANVRLLDDIRTFRQVTRMAYTEAEESVEYLEMMVESVRDVPAYRMVISSTDEEDAFRIETVQIEDMMYMNYDGEWIATSGQGYDLDDMDDMLGMWGWTDPSGWETNAHCSSKGRETINGMRTHLWECPQQVFLDEWDEMDETFVLTSGFFQMWVSEEYGIAVKTRAEWTGLDEGVEVGWSMESEITDINQPITITAPEGVAAPALPDDIPLIAGAQDLSVFGNLAMFSVAQTLANVEEFYLESMQDNDWEYEEQGWAQPGFLSFAKEDRVAQIMMHEEGANTEVTIMWE